MSQTKSENQYIGENYIAIALLIIHTKQEELYCCIMLKKRHVFLLSSRERTTDITFIESYVIKKESLWRTVRARSIKTRKKRCFLKTAAVRKDAGDYHLVYTITHINGEHMLRHHIDRP